MKKLKNLLLCSLMATLYIGCGKPTNCNRSKLKKYDYHPEMGLYFDVYKQNNWWVYENTDSTAKDSVYVTDYKEILNESCQQKMTTHIREMHVYSNLMFGTIASFHSEYAPGPTKDVINIYGTPLSFYFSYDGTSILNANGNPAVYNDIKIGNKMYKNCLTSFNAEMGLDTVGDHDWVGANIWFAPNIGLVKITTKKDTFLLKKYYLF